MKRSQPLRVSSISRHFRRRRQGPRLAKRRSMRLGKRLSRAIRSRARGRLRPSVLDGPSVTKPTAGISWTRPSAKIPARSPTDRCRRMRRSDLWMIKRAKRGSGLNRSGTKWPDEQPRPTSFGRVTAGLRRLPRRDRSLRAPQKISLDELDAAKFLLVGCHSAGFFAGGATLECADQPTFGLYSSSVTGSIQVM